MSHHLFAVHKHAFYPVLFTISLAAFFAVTLMISEETPSNAHVPQAMPKSPVPTRVRAFVDDYAQLNAMREDVISLPSGVQYEVLKAGSGKQPHPSDSVTVHYRAMLATGVEFGNTYASNKPDILPLDQYIVPGLKEALLLMREGDEWRVTIPAKMGFTGGRFLRKRDLIYEVTLLSVENTGSETEAPKEPQDSKPH